MHWGRTRRAGVFLLAAGLLHCGPQKATESRFEQCALDPMREFGGVGAVDGGPNGSQAIALGQSDGTTFTPYTDGGTVPVVLGLQGGYMITPSLRIDLLPNDPDSICLTVTATQRLDTNLEISPGFSGTFQFTRRAGTNAGYTEPVFDLLSYAPGLSGHTLTLDVSVDENGVVATDSKKLLLK